MKTQPLLVWEGRVLHGPYTLNERARVVRLSVGKFSVEVHRTASMGEDAWVSIDTGDLSYRAALEQALESRIRWGDR